MKKRLFFFGMAAALIVSGCVSSVRRPLKEANETSHAAVSPGNQISSVSISLSDAVKKKAHNDPHFDPEKLLDHIRRALDANGLVNNAADKPRPSVEVQVKNVRIRSYVTAVVLGPLAGADSIVADVVLKDPESKELDRFEVSVSYTLGGESGGQDEFRTGWLYERFAKETVRELMR